MGTRHCYTSSGRRESVAEHSWRISLMAMLLTKEFPEADMDKVIRMCLIHDMGEAFTGDIPTFEKTNADTRRRYSSAVCCISASPPRTEFPAVLWVSCFFLPVKSGRAEMRALLIISGK